MNAGWWTISSGTTTNGIVGEIVAVHVEEEAYTQDDRLDLGKLKPSLYLEKDFYMAPDPARLSLVERPQG